MKLAPNLILKIFLFFLNQTLQDKIDLATLQKKITKDVPKQQQM